MPRRKHGDMGGPAPQGPNQGASEVGLGEGGPPGAGEGPKDRPLSSPPFWRRLPSGRQQAFPALPSVQG